MRLACLFLFIFATLVHHSAAFCGSNGEYLWDGSTKASEPTNSTEFRQNLGDVLDALPTNETKIRLYSFAGVHQGMDPNWAYARARCIGPIDYPTCHECIQKATKVLINECSREWYYAFLWYEDYCMVQYSNQAMDDTVQMRDDLVLVKNETSKVEPSSMADTFNEVRTKLFNVLSSRAKVNPDVYMFAAGKWYDGSINMTIYGAAECSWDLNSDHCGDCLAILSRKLVDYFDGKTGGSIVGPSCNFRYDVNSFIDNSSLVVEYLSPPLPPPPPTPPQNIEITSPLVPSLSPPSTGARKNKAQLVIYIVAPIVTIGIILFVSIYVFLTKKKQNKPPTQQVEIVGKTSDEDDGISEHDIKPEETLQYDLSTISTATDNFSNANKLGEGGFGAVYKGKLPSGKEIAVKRLSETSKQGEVEFKNEVMLLANLQHKNLVQLLGFCLKRKERLLIYEFVANSSLDNFIFDPVKRAHLSWDRLYKIIGGVARGLLYLHEDSRIRIIHRDLKSSNILLDNELTPKIADFGMARLFPNDETQGSTSKIVGTFGYMAPEYLMHGHISTKSDVFSFGVLLLEIVCGRRNNFSRVGDNVENLISYAWKSWHEGTILNLIDPALKLDTSSTDDMTRCIHIGLLCTQEDVTTRPIMASVVNMLSNPSITLMIPSKPFFQQRSNINQETPLLEEYGSGMTSNSSGSKNKSSNSWTTTDTELYPR